MRTCMFFAPCMLACVWREMRMILTGERGAKRASAYSWMLPPAHAVMTRPIRLVIPCDTAQSPLPANGSHYPPPYHPSPGLTSPLQSMPRPALSVLCVCSRSVSLQPPVIAKNCDHDISCSQLRNLDHLYLSERGFRQSGGREPGGRMSVQTGSDSIDPYLSSWMLSLYK